MVGVLTATCAYAQAPAGADGSKSAGEHADAPTVKPSNSPDSRKSPAAAASVPRSLEVLDPSAENPFSPQPGSLVRFEWKDGRIVWAPYGAWYEDFVEFLRKRSTAGRNLPDFSINSVSLDGSADDETATLTARIELQIERETGPLKIPVAMPEGYVVPPGWRHVGPGEFRPPVPANRATGHTVSIRGKGLHTLFVPIVVPLRRQLDQRHLQLTIPASAASQIRLRVPKPRTEVRPIEGAYVPPAKSDEKGTLIEAFGLKGQFDLAWQSPNDEPQARPVFDVFNKCTLGMEGNQVLLNVLQSIDPKQGNLSSVKVRVPVGFRLIAAQQMYVADAKKFGPQDIDANGSLRMDLKPIGSGRIELRWELEARPLPNTTLTLQAFEVEGARSETGDVSIIPIEGFHFDYRGGTNVRRINVSTLGVGLAESAYSFSQPFRLELGLAEVRPQFSVDPVLFLLLSEQRTELSAQFRIQVHQGAVRELSFQWPDWKRQGWTVEQLPESAEIVGAESKDSTAGNTLRFRLNAGRRGSEFVLAFRAARPMPKGESFPITLPVLAGSLRPASTLVIADAENVKSVLEPQSDTVVQPLAPEPQDPASLPESFRGLRRHALRIESASQAFDASVAIEPQEIDTESLTHISVEESRLQVLQQITFQVSYERLAEVALVLPKELKRTDVQFFVDRNEPASATVPSWTAPDPRSEQQARIAFVQPRIGTFAIFAKYFVPLTEPSPTEMSTDVSVPFLRSRDGAFKGARVELRTRDETDVEVKDEDWSPQIAMDDTSTHAWTASGDKSQIPLRLIRTGVGAAPGLRIGKAVVRSAVDLLGTVQTTAQYRIESPVSSIALVLPRGASQPQFSLNGVPLKPDRVREIRPDTKEFRVEIGASTAEGPRVLSVNYSEPNRSPCGLLAVHHLDAPTLPEGTAIDTMAWEVAFPYEQFLFLTPFGFSPEFRWQRDFVFWSRKPTQAAANLDGWLGTVAPRTERDRNLYAFSRFGAARTIVVGSMAQSFVLFAGAGLALVGSFLLLKVRLTRSLLTLFVVAFCISTLSLWYPEAVRLLIQPALLGGLLAAGAAIFDERMQRRRLPFLLAMPSPIDFAATAASPSSLERVIVGGVGGGDAEAPTVSRPPNDPEGGLALRMEVGSSR